MKKEIKMESYIFDWEQLELKKIEEEPNGVQRPTKNTGKDR